MVWGEPSPSSPAGAVTRGSASQLHHGLNSCVPSWLHAGQEDSLLLLTCKITAAFPSPQARILGAGAWGLSAGTWLHPLLTSKWCIIIYKASFTMGFPCQMNSLLISCWNSLGNLHNLAAKENGLKCARMNNDDFTVLVSRGSRCC